MRRVQDYYFKKAKKDKYPARSVYKLEEIQRKYRLLRRGDSVLDLGCYPGSWSLYASEIVGPRGVVVGVDLQEADKVSQSGGAQIHWICHDITEPGLMSLLRKLRPGYKVVISDIAPKTTGNRWADHQQSMRLIRETLALAGKLLNINGHFYCKAFQGEDFPEFIKEVKEQFQKVKTIKPKSSRTESREVFVLGMGFHRK